MQNTLSESQRWDLASKQIQLDTLVTLVKTLEQFNKKAISKKELNHTISELDNRIYQLKGIYGLEN